MTEATPPGVEPVGADIAGPISDEPSAEIVRPVPLGAAAIFGHLLDLYAANVVQLLTLSAVLTVPVLVLTWPLPGSAPRLANTFAALLTGGALIVAFARLQRGEPVHVRESLGTALSQVVRLFGVSLVLGIIVVIAAGAFVALGALVTPAFFVPGIALGLLLLTRWGLAGQAVMIEGRAINAAFSRSAELVKPAWRTAVPVVAGASLFALGSAAWAFGAAAAGLPEAAVVAVTAVVTVVLEPISPGALTLLFLTLRDAHDAVEYPAPAPRLVLSGSRRAILATALAAVLLVGTAWAALGFLGPVRNQLVNEGRVRFGTTMGGDVCDVGGAGDSFPPGASVFWSSVLKPQVSSGQTLVVEISKDGSVVNLGNKTLTTDAACFGSTRPIGPLQAGTYTIRILHGVTVEATGSVSIH